MTSRRDAIRDALAAKWASGLGYGGRLTSWQTNAVEQHADVAEQAVQEWEAARWAEITKHPAPLRVARSVRDTLRGQKEANQ